MTTVPVLRARPAVLPVFTRAILDQFRMHALSPMSVLATLPLPFVIAFVVHTETGGRDVSSATVGSLAVGCAGAGMLDSIVVMIVVSIIQEKKWRTLTVALATPDGMIPVVLGRLTGVALQSLATLPCTLVAVALLWGIDAEFPWARWSVGGMLLGLATVSLVGLLAFVVLRFPYSAGMTNGLVSLVMAFSALIVPPSALPGPMTVIALLLPQSHVMNWVRGGGPSELLLAVVLTLVYAALIVAALGRVELIARRDAVPLEV